MLLPDLDRLAEWITEAADEIATASEGFCDDLARAVEDPEVRSRIARLLDCIAQRVHYGVADKRLGTHLVTVRGEEPYVDGEPLYRRAAS